MKILYICHRIPYPPNKGDKIRSFNEIKYLHREHELSLAFLIDDEEDVRHLAALEGYASTLDYAIIDARWQKIKSIPYLLTAKPLSVPYFYSTRLQELIDHRLQQEAFDVIFCFSSPMAEYIFKSRHYGTERLRNVRLVMDFVDVDSDKWRMYSKFSGFPMSAIYSREWRSLQHYEDQVARNFNQSIFVSENEAELFRTFGSGARLSVVRNGVDFEHLAAPAGRRPPGENPSPVFLFTGAMDYFPNEDAVVYFRREVFPRILAVLPSASFYIVGSKPSKRVLELAEEGRVTVTGFVEDIAPYLARADVFVAPLRIARGVQNKVLEAMASGVPVVARPEAVQGLSRDSAGVVVADTAEDFAARAIELATHPQKRRLAVEAARRCIEQHFHWQANLSRLENIVAGEASGSVP